jgi:hypothetical protein
MGVQRLCQHDGRGGVAAQVALQRGVAEAGGVVVLEQRGAVDHRVHRPKRSITWAANADRGLIR